MKTLKYFTALLLLSTYCTPGAFCGKAEKPTDLTDPSVKIVHGVPTKKRKITSSENKPEPAISEEYENDNQKKYKGEKTLFIKTPEEHVDILKTAILSSKKRLVIVSPFISSYMLEKHKILEDIKLATSRFGTEVIVFTDTHLDSTKDNSEKGRKLLFEAGADLRVVDKVHAKHIIIDDEYMITGSFNWLSAVTDKTSPYCRFETSILTAGEQTTKEAGDLLKTLESMPVKSYKGFHKFYEEARHARKGLLSSKDKVKSAIELFEKYKSDPYFKNISLNILLEHLDEVRHTPKILKYLNKNGYKLSDPAIQGHIETLINCCSDDEDFLELAEAIFPVNKDKAKEIAEMMIPYIEPLENVDDTVSRLYKMGFSELGDKVEYEAYYSEDAKIASKF